jgi:methylated-DNA-[protein]-cysteine S-methyltransferase
MRRNPFPLIVPCHRVIRSNGDIGKYAGGEYSVKLWLIRHEQK